MNKKATPKLALHRDTLRQLDEELQQAAGNGPDPSWVYSRCPSCGIIPCSQDTCNPSTCG